MNHFQVRSDDAVLLTVTQASDRYNISRYALMKLAEECSAVVHISERIVRINRVVIDAKLGIKD